MAQFVGSYHFSGASQCFSPAAIGDIDDDGYPEISQQVAMSFEQSTMMVRPFGLQMSSTSLASGVIFDFEGDGVLMWFILMR